VLASIPKRSTTILTSSRCRPWTEDGFGSSFNKAKIDAGLAESDLHFHDLRGTAATRFYIAGLPERVIAGIMAWEEEHVAKIIRRYVTGRQRRRRSSISSTRLKSEHNLQNRLQNRQPDWS
jgi:integrase